MILSLLLWTIGTTIMWFSGHRVLPLVDEPEVPCGWRAVAEMARAMERELVPEGIDITAMTDKQVKQEVRKRLKGGAVSFENHALSRGPSGLWRGIWAFAKEEKGWVAMLVVSLAIALAMAGSQDMDIARATAQALGISFGSLAATTAFVVWLGSTLASRLLVFFVLNIIIIIPCVTSLHY